MPPLHPRGIRHRERLGISKTTLGFQRDLARFENRSEHLEEH
jgi:hypothetical protein